MRLIALFVLLGIDLQAASGVLLVSHTSAAATSGPADVVTPAIDTTGSTLIVASVSSYSGGTFILQDSASNTWTGLPGQTNTSMTETLFYTVNASTSSSHTFTVHVTGGSVYGAIAVAAFSGVAATAAFDQTAGTTLTYTSLQPGPVTPSQGGELIVSGLAMYSTSVTATASSGYTITDQLSFNSGVSWGIGLMYAVQGIAAAANPAWMVPSTQIMSGTNATFRSAVPFAPSSFRHTVVMQ